MTVSQHTFTYETSFSYTSFFGGSKLLVIVPHQDDEVNTAGATIVGSVQEGLEVHIAYMTNGDWDYDVPLRNHEALNACAMLGVPSEQVHFLGYPDCGSDMYSVYEHQNVEFTYHNRQISWATLLEDIKNLIHQIKPDAIICTGFDSHRDHRQCESAVLSVMTQLWSQESKIPLYTGFAYGTAYESIDDWYSPHFHSTKMNPAVLLETTNNTENINHVENKYTRTTPSIDLAWDKRLRLPVPAICRQENLTTHILYRALGCHISQAAYRRSSRIINGDQVFWYRGPHRIEEAHRTDRLNRPYGTDASNRTAVLDAFTYIHILINDDVTYDYVRYVGETRPNITVYVGNSTMGVELPADDDGLEWYCNGSRIENGSYETIQNYMIKHGVHKVRLRCVWRSEPSIVSTVEITNGNYRHWLRYGVWYVINRIHYELDHYKRKKNYKKLRLLMRPFNPISQNDESVVSSCDM